MWQIISDLRSSGREGPAADSGQSDMWYMQTAGTSDVTSTKTLKYKYKYKYLVFLQLHINYSSKDDVKIVLSCKLTNQKENCCREHKSVTKCCCRLLH